MISNIVTVAALAGTALASCPLSVEIVGANRHVAQVAVTNTGNETVTVFKGNTVLSEHATKDLIVSDAAGKEIPFEGVFVNYKRSDLPASAFQTFAPGETITVSVNAARSHKLAGVKSAKITAIQGFRYAIGATPPAALKEMATCADITSGTITITPDQSKVADEHITKRADVVVPRSSRINKRSITYHSCTSAQTSSLQTSVSHTISMASAAYTAANTALYYYTTWFKATSTETKVRSIYNKVTGVQTTSPTISCTDTYSDCTDGTALLYTIPSANYIVPCPSNGFWGFPEYATTCADDDYDRAGSILHEVTHLYGTNDYAYGQTAAKALSATQAAANADTYEIYAGSVRLGGCSS
ncbi:hypothetical protein B0T22DRAFT_536384 [Podospora appendiculata]|uniref:deuterolysin n=1 Tax=Podospora appendiculata TaxID=314037 RepID=A0AAE0XB96_9PEZI|nr:hypothetical protein B0T22DRAFT_536384 [Podospora appendiculata]